MMVKHYTWWSTHLWKKNKGEENGGCGRTHKIRILVIKKNMYINNNIF